MIMPSLGLSLFSAQALLGQTGGAINIPGPNPNSHDFKVAVSHFPLTDAERSDPHNESEPRMVMVSMFMPVRESACSSECILPYMPPQTARIADEQFLLNAPTGVFGQMQYYTCCKSKEPIDAAELPLVFIDAHTDTSRLLYSNLARFVSANGAVVVLVDHPGDTSIVEFPSGSGSPQQIVYNSGTTGLGNFAPINPWNSTVSNAVNIRVADINFVLEHIASQPFLEKHFSNFRFGSALNTGAYSIVGHGLGGTVASAMSFTDPRARFGLVMSGTPPLLNDTSAATLFFLGTQKFNRTADIHWSKTWAQLTGPVTEIDILRSDNFDLTDLPIIVELAHNEGQMPNIIGRGLGTDGAWPNHAAVCLVEGVIREQLLGNRVGVSQCVGLFPSLVPWMEQKMVDE